MELIADILLVAGALGAAFYCFVLSRRLKNFNDLEKGVGGAVAVLSSQVDDLRRTLDAARSESSGNAKQLADLTVRAEATAQRLELMMASLHDLPVEQSAPEVEEPKSAPATGTQAVLQPRAKGEPMFVRHPRKAQEAAE